jgi:hypothetical protein
MFLVVEYPFVDMRGFIGQSTGRLLKPAWPIAEAGKDFIRSCGMVRPRPRGGVGQWAGEDLFGDASSALKFPDQLRLFPFCRDEEIGQIDCAFRRFYSDGTVARLEVGLRLRLMSKHRGLKLLPDIDTLRRVLCMNVTISKAGAHSKAVRLVDAGDVLARHFLRSSTVHADISESNVEPWWVTAAKPALIIETKNSIQMPRHTQRVLDASLFTPSLFHSWVQMGTQRMSAWFLISNGVDPSSARNLRIHLMRLHAERESLRCILMQIHAGKLVIESNSPSSEALQQYISDTLHVMHKSKRFGNNQSGLLEAAQDAFDFALQGETASLGWMRRQVAERLQRYIERSRTATTVINNIQGNLMNTSIQMGNVSVSGNFTVVTADNIKNSFNTAASSDVSDDLKNRLKDLTVLVADLANSLPREDAEKVSQDLEAFVKESTLSKPRKSWLDLSSQGLLDAAKTVADMAAPVATAVKAVLGILEF